ATDEVQNLRYWRHAAEPRNRDQYLSNANIFTRHACWGIVTVYGFLATSRWPFEAASPPDRDRDRGTGQCHRCLQGLTHDPTRGPTCAARGGAASRCASVRAEGAGCVPHRLRGELRSPRSCRPGTAHERR